MQISYDRQLSEISAYRNRILLFQVSMMLRKTQADLYIITGEFSSNSQRVYAFNTVNFRCRDRLVERGVGSIDLLVSYRPSRFDPPSTPPLSLRSKKLNFQTSRYRTWRLDIHFPSFVTDPSIEEVGSDATGVARDRPYLHSCKMHPRTGRGNAIHGDLCI